MAEDSSHLVTDMTEQMAKKDPDRDGSTSSTASSPEPDQETYAQENPQQQKRKGGRKPVGFPFASSPRSLDDVAASANQTS
jgi:hypothetical protein